MKNHKIYLFCQYKRAETEEFHAKYGKLHPIVHKIITFIWWRDISMGKLFYGTYVRFWNILEISFQWRILNGVDTYGLWIPTMYISGKRSGGMILYRQLYIYEDGIYADDNDLLKGY